MKYNYISHKVVYGDTLQRIATAYSIEDWSTIAEVNNLEYPYIISDSVISDKQPNLKYIGDIILIPLAENNWDKLDNYSQDELESLALGSDLSLSQVGVELVNVELPEELVSDNIGNLAIVSGFTALAMNLLFRLGTEPGDLVLHPEFGSDFLSLLGKPKTKSTLVKMKLSILDTFKSDIRVQDVQNIKVEPISGGVSISCGILTKNPKTLFKLVGNIQERS